MTTPLDSLRNSVLRSGSLPRLTPILMFAAFIAGSAQADFFGISWSGPVYRINDQTGTAAVIKQFPTRINCLAGPYQGYYYGTADNLLYKIDPQTGAIVSTTTLQISDFRAAAFSPAGELFANHTLQISPGFQTQLSKININTGAVTTLSTVTLGVGGMAFAPNGILYAWNVGANGDGNGLGLVRLATNGASYVDVNPLVGTAGARIQSLDFTPAGKLFGANDALFSIDLTTGQPTRVGNQTYTWDVRGIAYVPEPTTATLLITLTAASLAAPFRRRR